MINAKDSNEAEKETGNVGGGVAIFHIVSGREGVTEVTATSVLAVFPVSPHTAYSHTPQSNFGESSHLSSVDDCHGSCRPTSPGCSLHGLLVPWQTTLHAEPAVSLFPLAMVMGPVKLPPT